MTKISMKIIQRDKCLERVAISYIIPLITEYVIDNGSRPSTSVRFTNAQISS